MPTLDIQDPKLYALTLSVAIDEFRRKLEDIAGHGRYPEKEPLADPRAFWTAHAEGLRESMVHIDALLESPHAKTVVAPVIPWHAIRRTTHHGYNWAYDLLSGIGCGNLWGRDFSVWDSMNFDEFFAIIGAAALLKDLARQLELKSEQRNADSPPSPR